MKELTQPVKWHGGKGAFKGALAKWIISLMPPRCKNPNEPKPDDPGYLHYVEPYFGGGSVLLANDPEGISEVVNDLNFDLTKFWLALQEDESFDSFMRIVEAVPFSEMEFRRESGSTDISWRAAWFFVKCRQSLSGRMSSFASITRNRTRRGMNEQASAWLNCIDGLPEVHARLKRVLILNRDALDVIRSEDGPRTLFYLDPPYLHETRATVKEYGTNEMTRDQHAELLATLGGASAVVALSPHCGTIPRSKGPIVGRFLLSGYRSEMYDAVAERCGWTRHEFSIPNNAAGGKEKRRMVECVWTNY